MVLGLLLYLLLRLGMRLLFLLCLGSWKISLTLENMFNFGEHYLVAQLPSPLLTQITSTPLVTGVIVVNAPATVAAVTGVAILLAVVTAAILLFLIDCELC